MPRVSMKDVARAAKVSQPAVSYAYNRPSKISDAQRKRIFSIAKKIGYPGPNALGRSLRSGKVGAIGLMMMDRLSLAFDDPSMTALLKGIGQSGEFEDLALTLFPLKYRGLLQARGQTDSTLAVRGLVDGLIISTLPDDHPIMTQLVERRIPFVIVDSPKIKKVHFVGIDDYSAAHTQLKHLLDLGHRKIAVIVDRLAPDSQTGFVSHDRFANASEAVTRERLRGYIDAASDVGLEFAQLRIMEAGGLGTTAGRAAAFKLLTTAKVTGVVATSDVMALSCLETAKDLDIEVPRKLSIVGFDDIPEAMPAGLTTIRQPMVEKGAWAAKIMKAMLDRPEEFLQPRQKLFATRLVIRTSTAAC